MSKTLLLLVSFLWMASLSGLGHEISAKEIAITLDDPDLAEMPLMTAKERDQKIRAALK